MLTTRSDIFTADRESRTSAALAEGLQQRKRQPQLQARELEDLRRPRQAHAPAHQHDDDVQHDEHGERDRYVEEDPCRPADSQQRMSVVIWSASESNARL